MSELCWCSVSSPIGELTLVADDDGLRHVLFNGQTLADLGLDAGELPEAPSDPVLAGAATQLAQYFAGERTTFELPMHVTGGDFERAVWWSLTTIPHGETISYGEQARRIGKPGAAQAVGAANGRNPLPIVLPCHRVVGSDGSLVGFGGGLATKQWLLDHESGTQRLF
ncbi:MAG: methylated-DNA--[protein]-cysteine S-methyltransferase [Actinomycetota bacterium]